MADRAILLLRRWRAELGLSRRERADLGPELAALDHQCRRLEGRRPRVAVLGRVGVGKSSLLNALLGADQFVADVAHGSTRQQEERPWPEPIPGLAGVDLVDTPGLDEVAAPARDQLARQVALEADLVVLVVDGDLTRVEAEALERLLRGGKPLVLVLNRCDCWPEGDLPDLLASLRRRLPPAARHLEPLAVAAAPREARLLADGRVRGVQAPPRVAPLREALVTLLAEDGERLLALNALRAADHFAEELFRCRLRHGRRQARTLIGRFAAAKAAGVALNPVMGLDLAGGMACDSALVLQLCRLYGLPMTRGGARRLLLTLGGHNALLGGTQLGLQALLGGLRQALLLAAPLSAGLSLAPAAPVAMAQAALAIHTTRRTGRLAAAALLRSRTAAGHPAALLRRLAEEDPLARRWLAAWPGAANRRSGGS
ncbi:MAG: GTP-binding protein [Cyanobacteriota bacterium]|nr:GTP-binding protein [Cyanobacteriota bacterium]